jgi:hypothetical protein
MTRRLRTMKIPVPQARHSVNALAKLFSDSLQTSIPISRINTPNVILRNNTEIGLIMFS